MERLTKSITIFAFILAILASALYLRLSCGTKAYGTIPTQTSMNESVYMMTKDANQYSFDVRINYQENEYFSPSLYLAQVRSLLQREGIKYTKPQFDSILKTPMFLENMLPLRSKNVYAIHLTQHK